MPGRVATWSLRERLALVAAGAMVAALLVGGATMYWAATFENDQQLDARLEQLGAELHAFVENELSNAAIDNAERLPSLKTRPSAALLYRFQVWSRQGKLLLRSHEAPADTPLMALGDYGFATVRIDREEYRAFALPARKQQFIVQVAENVDEQWREVGRVSAYYTAFLALPFALVFGIAWLMLRHSLRAIDAMAEQLGNRNPLSLSLIQVDDPPRELLPILNSIDALFAQVDRAMSAERSFTALAAHEIRTPLAGLRAQAQLAGVTADPAELQAALGALRSGVDRAAHLLDQLLDLARIEALPPDRLAYDWVSLPDLYHGVLADLGALAAAKQIDIAARFDAQALQGHRFALHVLLRNLLANAILYSPSGGSVRIRSEATGVEASITVDDAGPGIAAADRERVFERFNRLGQTRVDGVGLGLAIVLSVVELHHAKIQLLDSPLGGLRVQLLFASAPRADAALGAAPPTP